MHWHLHEGCWVGRIIHVCILNSAPSTNRASINNWSMDINVFRILLSSFLLVPLHNAVGHESIFWQVTIQLSFWRSISLLSLKFSNNIWNWSFLVQNRKNKPWAIHVFDWLLFVWPVFAEFVSAVFVAFELGSASVSQHSLFSVELDLDLDSVVF